VKIRQLHPLSLKTGYLIHSQAEFVVLMLYALVVALLQHGKKQAKAAQMRPNTIKKVNYEL
jgi:hypothetical protein